VFWKGLSIWSYVFLFMKKDTLLYLDADLVERAKRENVNISRLSEDALKEALKITVPPTARELENVYPFQDFEAKFRKGALNVIYGALRLWKINHYKVNSVRIWQTAYIFFQVKKRENNPPTVSRPRFS